MSCTAWYHAHNSYPYGQAAQHNRVGPGSEDKSSWPRMFRLSNVILFDCYYEIRTCHFLFLDSSALEILLKELCDRLCQSRMDWSTCLSGAAWKSKIKGPVH